VREKILKFAELPREEKKLFIEAWLTLGAVRMAILTLPFKRLTRSLEHSPQAEKVVPLDEIRRRKALQIGRAIERAAAHTPWESACLAQSLTARRMLQKRGIPGVFYLGVSAGRNDPEDKKIKAHAWSQCDDIIVTGGKGHERFTVLSVFAWTETGSYDTVKQKGGAAHK